MTALRDPITVRATPSRRQRAAATVAGALRGGLLAAAVAGVAWLLATLIAATAFLVLLVATVVVAIATVVRGDAKPGVWGALAAGWAVVLIERWAVSGHGGVWVAAAAWLGVLAGARSAGIRRWALPLLAYPLVSVAIVIAAHQSLLSPWGVSWLWVAAVLGPVIGARTLLNPSPRKAPPAGRSPRAPLAEP